MYIQEELGEGTTPQEITKELGARWKELDDSEKKPYLKVRLSFVCMYMFV